MESWYHIAWSADHAANELAKSAALLSMVTCEDPQHAYLPVLRWYSVAAPALVLGAGQPMSHIDIAACHAASIPVHRRASGGTAVLLEPTMLMMDIALPYTHRLALRDVTESYRWLGEIWALALQSRGIGARMLSVAEARADTATLDPLLQRVCYGGRSPYEVIVDGYKVVGFAQLRRRAGILLQVGIYMEWQPERLVSLLAISPTERKQLTSLLQTRVTGLYHSDLLPHATPIEPMWRWLQSAFTELLFEKYQIVFLDMSPSITIV